MYLDRHKYEVACGAIVVVVPLVRMLSSDNYRKPWKGSESAMRCANAPFALQMKRNHIDTHCKHLNDIVYDGSKDDFFVCASIF